MVWYLQSDEDQNFVTFTYKVSMRDIKKLIFLFFVLVWLPNKISDSQSCVQISDSKDVQGDSTRFPPTISLCGIFNITS